MEKITKVSAFSGLNQLRDLTMKRKEYASLLGYTPKEIAAQFTVRTLMVNFSNCVGILAFGALLFVYDVPLAILSLVSAAVTFVLVGWNLRRLGSESQAMMAAHGEEAGLAMLAKRQM